MTPSLGRMSWLYTSCVIFCAALLCSQMSFRLRAPLLDDVIEGDRQILLGHAAEPEFQNRVLAPALRWGLERASGGRLGPRQSWKAVRLLSACLAFGVLYWCVRRMSGSHVRGLAAVVWMAYGYLWTPMTHAWEHSTDFFDIAFLAMMTTAALEGRAVTLLVLTVLAAFNRESAAFGGLILLGQVWFRRDLPRRHFAWGVGCVVAAAIAVEAIRYTLGGGHSTRQMLGILRVLPEWRDLFVPYGALTAAIAMFLPIVLALVALPRPWTAAQRGLLAACAAVTALACVFGIVVELRVLLPTYVLLVFVLAGSSESDEGWLKSALGQRG